jgi:hypothetical protein
VTLHNTGAAGTALIGASSPACGTLMLHQSLNDSGTERMVMVMRLPLPAHGTVQLAPGGYHLMCLKPQPGLHAGASVPVVLRLQGGGTLQVRFAVKGADGVRVLFVTVDPNRDTLPVLTRYCAAFRPAFDGLRSTPDALLRLARRYRVAYSVTPESAEHP